MGLGRRFVPAAVVSAVLAFAVAAGSIGFVPDSSRLWGASLALVILGGITPLIYTVNLRIVPVFSRRSWPAPRLLYSGIVAGALGGWVVVAGRALGDAWIERAGSLLALAGGVLFSVSVMRLFRSPVTNTVAPPLPFPEQAAVDRIATRFTALAGLYLLLGLSVGLMLTFWTPDRGRWPVVWAHTLLVGWFVTMASGVSYHVLSRWTGARWRSVRTIGLHLRLVQLGLPLMVLALALDLRALFAVAGPLQALALLLLVWNIAPLARALPALTRLGFLSAGAFLSIGVSLGASMAMIPAQATNLRITHAEINLFGWTGLLICGAGYYLFPRFFGKVLRWPRLAKAQLLAHAAGVALSAGGWWWYLAVDRAARPLLTAGALLTASSFLTFALIQALTFRGSGHVVSSGVTLQPQQRRRTLPMR
jgi:hypothetical protein